MWIPAAKVTGCLKEEAERIRTTVKKTFIAETVQTEQRLLMWAISS